MIPTYSVAKTFTAAALVRTGVNLGAAAGEYLDVGAHFSTRRVSDLLQHISGLPDYHALSEYRSAVAAREDAWSVDELLERATTLPDVKAGDFSYSNIGFTLLRLILEKTSGHNFFEALNHHIFLPLGIGEVAPLSTLGDWDKCEVAPDEVRSYDPQWVYPGMVLATPEAMSQAFRGIFAGALFDAKPLLESVAVNAPGHTFSEPRYGRGVMIDADRWVAHGGGGPGFTLFTLCRPDGSAAHTAFRVGDDNGDELLIKECLEKLS